MPSLTGEVGGGGGGGGGGGDKEIGMSFFHSHCKSVLTLFIIGKSLFTD